jgi:hypothetical protein
MPGDGHPRPSTPTSGRGSSPPRPAHRRSPDRVDVTVSCIFHLSVIAVIGACRPFAAARRDTICQPGWRAQIVLRWLGKGAGEPVEFRLESGAELAAGPLRLRRSTARRPRARRQVEEGSVIGGRELAPNCGHIRQAGSMDRCAARRPCYARMSNPLTVVQSASSYSRTWLP